MDQNNRRSELSQILSNNLISGNLYDPPSVSVDVLLDVLIALYEDCKATNPAKSSILAQFIDKYESIIKNIKMLRWNASDFETTKLLAKGAFGEVYLAKHTPSGRNFAMKLLKKAEMIRQSETAFFMEEKEIMVLARDSKWLVSIHSAFQDEENLYLIMDFIPGGDLMSLLCNQDGGIFTEDAAKFYAAEILLAIEDLHKMNFVHRDLKPDNLLIDGNGHIKLADFGSCIKLDKDGMVSSKAAVGTPDYISPEVLKSQNGSSKYGKECDLWSFGVLIFEMLTGEPPFYSDSLVETYGKIMEHEKNFVIPEDIQITSEARSIIKSLICDAKDRLELSKIKDHPFFKGINWDEIHLDTPPFLPEIKSADDFSNFEDDEELEPSKAKLAVPKSFAGYNLPFIGYTYHPDQMAVSVLKSSGKGQFSSRLTLKSLDDRTEVDNEQSGKIKELQSKLSKMENQNASLNENISSLKREAQLQAEELKSLGSAKSDLEKAKAMLEIEYKDTSKKLLTLLQEKETLDKKLSELQKNNVEMKRSSISVLDFSKYEVGFKEELECAKKELVEEKFKSANFEKHLNELIKAKKVHEEEEEILRTKLETLQKTNEELLKKIDSIKAELQSALSREAEMKEKLGNAEAKAVNLEKEISVQSILLGKEQNKRKQMEEKYIALDKEKTSLEYELEQKGKECLNLIEVKKEYERKIASFEDEVKSSRGNDMNMEQIELKEKEISQLREEKEAISVKLKEWEEKLFKTQKNMAIKDIELKDIKAQLENEVAHSKQVQEKKDEVERAKKEVEDRLSSLRQNLQSLEAENSRISSSISHLNNLKEKEMAEKDLAMSRMAKVESLKKELESQCEDYKKRCHELERETVKISKLLEESNLNLLKEKESHISNTAEMDLLRGSYSELNAKLEATQKLLQESEVDLLATQKTLSSLQIDFDTLSRDLKKERCSRESLEIELKNLDEKLKAEIIDLKTKVEEYETSHEKLSREQQETLKIYSELSTNYEKEMKCKSDMEIQIEKLKQKISFDQVKISELVRKMQDMIAVQPEKSKFLSFFSGSSGSSSIVAKPANNEDSELKKQLKVKQRDMKALEQRLNAEINSRKALETELTEVKALKLQLESELEDLNTIATQRRFSSRSVRNTNIVDAKIVLEGWLKIPTENGSKLWKKVWVCVQDFKILLCEKDKDTSSTRCVAHLKSDVFCVRSVLAKEMIHVPAKDVNNIFMVQSTFVGNNSIRSLSSTASPIESVAVNTSSVSLTEIKTKIKNIEKDIEVEERVRKGIENLRKASTSSANKANAEKQLEGSDKKLVFLRSELEKYKGMEGSRMSLISSHTETNSASLVEELSPVSEDLEVCSTKELDLTSKEYEFLGHHFKTSSFNAPTVCHFCGDVLWGSNKQGLKCSGCAMICHKNCHTLIDLNCSDFSTLISCKPFYFMTNDCKERDKWIKGLNMLRKAIREEGGK